MRQFLLSLVCIGLASCASSNAPYTPLFRQALGLAYEVDDSKLDPIYRYLRITILGRSSYVLLGDIDKNAQGLVEVFYGGGGEVLRFQNGRLAGATGLVTEWQNVSLHDVPTWTSAGATAQVSTWRRVRDVMPGYRYGLEEQISLRKIAHPQRTALAGIKAEQLMWFEEHLDKAASPLEKLPPARYAVSFENNRETVVYGEQCLSSELCLAWQQWTPRKK